MTIKYFPNLMWLNRARSICQNSNMTRRLSGHISIFRLVCAQVFSGNCETMESWKMCSFFPKAWESCKSIDHSRKTILTYHNALCLSPQNFAYALFSVSLRPILTPKRNKEHYGMLWYFLEWSISNVGYCNVGKNRRQNCWEQRNPHPSPSLPFKNGVFVV